MIFSSLAVEQGDVCWEYIIVTASQPVSDSLILCGANNIEELTRNRAEAEN